MKKTMKKAICLGSALAITFSMSAFAATPDIKVQIDGENVQFSDANPIAKDGRTYVPFRAIFEEIGATVDYNADTKTVTADKDSHIVEFTIGSTDVKVTKDGDTSIVKTDAASFAQNNRTFVPVRFAAETLGYNVGWDQDDKTVVITDVDAIVKNSGETFEVMDQLMEYSKKFSLNTYKLEGTMKMSMEVNDNGELIPVIMDGKVTGITSATSAEMDMDMNMDISALLAQMTPSEIEANKELIKQLENINMNFIMDIETGKMYIQSKLIDLMLGASGDIWYSIDMNDMLAQSGLNMNMMDLMKMSTNTDFAQMMTESLRMSVVVDKDDDTLKKSFDMIAKMYGDTAFVKSSEGYEAVHAIYQDGAVVETVTKIITSNGNIIGYDMSVTTSVDDVVIMEVSSKLDSKNKMTVKMGMNVPEFMTMNFDMEVKYTETREKPNNIPGSSSTIISINDIMTGAIN